MNNALLFFYGRIPGLSRYEASCVYSSSQFTPVTESIDLVESIQVEPDAIISRLGGIVRIAQEIALLPELEAESIAQQIHIQEEMRHEFRFVLSTEESVYVPSPVLLQIKKHLETFGHKVRFSVSSSGHMASAAQVHQKDTVEYCLVGIKEHYVLAKTRAIQNPDQWTKRDMGRPAVDTKRGMLPLKVARIAANIALGSEPDEKTCIDPFCGMGTILSEGIHIGGLWYGSDIAQEAVEGTKKNIQWLKSTHTCNGSLKQLFIADAVHLSEFVEKESFDAVVTEPFLGNPGLGEGKIVDPKEIRNIVKGLEKLYIGCLKDWRAVLKPNGRVIIALPSFTIQRHKESVKKVIDSCESLGYSIEAGPFVYGRPDAVVERNFYILRKINT